MIKTAAIIFLITYLFTSPVHALVWDGTSLPPWLVAEMHSELWNLNNAEIEWRSGRSQTSLAELDAQFVAWASQRKARTYGGEAFGRMIRCYYGTPSSGCLFARRAAATHLQFVELRGMPKVKGPARVIFADQNIAVGPDETYLHLQPQSPRAASLLFIRHAAPVDWNTLKTHWTARGWRLSSTEANDLFYEKERSFLYVHRRAENLWMIHQPDKNPGEHL